MQCWTSHNTFWKSLNATGFGPRSQKRPGYHKTPAENANRLARLDQQCFVVGKGFEAGQDRLEIPPAQANMRDSFFRGDGRIDAEEWAAAGGGEMRAEWP